MTRAAYRPIHPWHPDAPGPEPEPGLAARVEALEAALAELTARVDAMPSGPTLAEYAEALAASLAEDRP